MFYELKNKSLCRTLKKHKTFQKLLLNWPCCIYIMYCLYGQHVPHKSHSRLHLFDIYIMYCLYGQHMPHKSHSRLHLFDNYINYTRMLNTHSWVVTFPNHTKLFKWSRIIVKVILYWCLILKKMNECITHS